MLENGVVQVISLGVNQPSVLEATESWMDRLNAAFGSDRVLYEIDNVGKVWIRIARYAHYQRSAYAFVKAEDGSIWKAASWKAPAKNFARGSVFKNQPISEFSV
jgi:hypothetical protein